MLEDILKHVGSFHRFQILLLCSILSSIFIFGMSMLVMTYDALQPDWWCTSNMEEIGLMIQNTSSILYKNCTVNITDSCSRVYDQDTKTLISQFDLVCGNKWIPPTITSIQMSGVLIGSFIGGQCADLFGRKKTLYVTILLHCVLNIIIAFSTSWQMFAALRFFIGGTIGAFLVVVLYVLEFIDNQHRALAVAIPFWAIGVCVLALVSFLLHDWVYLHITIGVLTFPYLLTWFIMPESARWLATKGRLEEAKDVFIKIAEMNGTDVPNDIITILTKVSEEERGGQKYTYLHIYKGWKIFRASICLQVAWACISAVYYGFAFGLSEFSGIFYLNLFIMSAMEIPLVVPVTFLMNKIGRRLTCCGLLVLAAGACVSVLIVQEVEDVSISNVITGLSLTAQLSTSSAWVSLMLLTNETYPTVVRYLGSGASNTAGKLGGIVAPFIFKLDSSRSTPYIISICMIVLCGISCFLLDDTNQLDLKDTTSSFKSKDTSTQQINIEIKSL